MDTHLLPFNPMWSAAGLFRQYDNIRPMSQIFVMLLGWPKQGFRAYGGQKKTTVIAYADGVYLGDFVGELKNGP